MKIKNKGFTLIELLAVIVILSIIMIIAVPKILDVIEKSRKTSFGESADLMAKTAQLKYTTSMLTNSIGNEEYIYENGKLTSDSPNLDFSGDKPFQGKIVLSNGRVSLAIISKNKKYCAIKNINQKTSKVYDITNDFTIDKCVIGYTGEEDSNPELPETDASCFNFDSSTNTIIGLSDSYSIQKCSTDLVIPSKINNKYVLNIKEGAFSNNSVITSVKFNSDNKITKINTAVFSSMPNLKEVVLPASLESIENYAFPNDSKLTVINFPETLTSIGEGAFTSTGLTSIDLKNVQKIGQNAFSSIKLVSLKIPNTVKSMGNGAFLNLNGTLKELIVENSNNVLNSTSDGTFLKNVQSFIGNTPTITKLTIKNYDNIDYTFTSIFPYVEELNIENVNSLSGSGMFANILSLKKVTLKNVKSIGQAVFYGDTSLKTINLPEKLENLASESISNTGVEELIIPSTLKNYDNAFEGNLKLKKVIIKKGVTSISEHAFIRCTSLNSVEIPNTVSSIGNHAFDGNILQNLDLPKSVVNLGGSAFWSSTIEKIIIKSNITNYINDAVCSNNCNVKEIVLEDGVDEIAFNPPEYGILSSVVKIIVPKSVTKVKDGAFRKYGTKNLSTICYRGSKSEFEKINVENNVFGNELWSNATKIYNCTD